MSFWPVVDAPRLSMEPESWWIVAHGAGHALWRGGDTGDCCFVTIRGEVSPFGISSTDKDWRHTGVTAIPITSEQAQKLIDVARHMHEPQWRVYIKRVWIELFDEAQRNA